MLAPMASYRLHHAPDNASLCVRLALLRLGVPFEAALVDRRSRAQKSPAFLALNPMGLIPVLETPDGPLFETGAILLWLAERHGDGLAPPVGHPDRGLVLTWLFWLANTLHPAMRSLFYPEQVTGPEGAPALVARTRERIGAMLDVLEAAAPRLAPWLGGERSSLLDCYLCPLLRWMAVYPQGGTDWFDLRSWPRLLAVAVRMETRPEALAAAGAEGLGPHPFTRPAFPTPPEGSPL